jgi:hypothetical protein
MPWRAERERVLVTMYARAVDDAAAHLRELRHEEWAGFGLGVVVLGVALVATEVRPALALPLFLGGLAEWFLGIRALWRRWDLLDRLAGQRDAHVISGVLAYASRASTMEKRLGFAASIRSAVGQAGPGCEPRVRAAVDDLEALASELEDEQLALDPACAVACMRLLSDPHVSPLLNPVLPPEDLRSHVFQIRSGFSRRQRLNAYGLAVRSDGGRRRPTSPALETFRRRWLRVRD